MIGNFRLKETICILDTIAVLVVISFASLNLETGIMRCQVELVKYNAVTKFLQMERKIKRVCKMWIFKNSPFV